ncbi:uncharacterized protein MELLADRAFT_115959 [Melampsora larici-populina 98AG31]|uniref:Uncharacterized protein n=1 Tax=Melampsora larici-populina (strain 98AG31 / pathotype 3-4-7) TaxID=747676 RepID=F4RGB6_MELLP|nr:uncharacterized protein MELLADRAFT_115959 [Melampsora larici-populina 98AG31]EGG08445.1 hypothetical protein MELLADRAFT_115959 [Melampsora larici-populina 98AG31]
MAPRTRKKGASAASKSSKQGNQPEDAAPGTNGLNTSTRAAVSKRPPQAPRSTNPSKRVRNNDATNANEPSHTDLSTGANDIDDQPPLNDLEVTPTLKNYKTLMKLWPPGRIIEHLREHKASTHNRPSTEVRDHVKLVFKQFNQELLMLAMIGQVSESTIKSIIPELTATRATSAYTLFLEYCIGCLGEPMPLRGAEEGGVVLGDRNRKNGARWRALSEDEVAVFDPIIFYALAGVPNPLLDLETIEDRVDDNQEEDGDTFVPIPAVHKLTVEEDELYRPIYERLVDLKKVENQLGKPSTGPSKSQLQRKSKTAIKRISHQLSCEAHRLDFAYYLVATSTVTPNKSTELGWLKQFTTHPQIATWANKSCSLATVFATYSQGESMAKAIALVNGKPKRQRPDKQQPSDKIKVDLGRLLAAITYKTLGYTPPQAFPQTADPVSEVKKRALPLSIGLAEGSRLTDEKLAVGFKKMQSTTRLEWINDIKDGKFRLTKLRVGSDEAIGEPVTLDDNEIEAALATTPRAMDKVVGSIDNNPSAESNSNQAANKNKNGGESDSTIESDDGEEED